MIKIYNKQKQLIAVLENAFDISYDMPINKIYTAEFSMPADDHKNENCQLFNYAEIFDGKERVELFRIVNVNLTRSFQGITTYSCEHVISTLLDDVLFNYHQIGNLGVPTSQVLRYVLDRQSIGRWQLGGCEFSRFFEYKWENENLLSALFSIAEVFDEDYMWKYDTTGSIWKIFLVKLSKIPTSDIIYKKNMVQIKKDVDATKIVTRLYCLGYGEGDNQLTIESVNQGLPYIDAPTISTWGIKTSVLTDRRFESAETLKAYGLSILAGLQNPYTSYTISCVDLNLLDKVKYSKFNLGEVVRIIDKQDNIVTELPIVRISKKNLTENIGDIELEIANATRDIASSITELADRSRINQTYAQGATNQMVIPFADNADPRNPVQIRFYIPETLVRINTAILNFKFEPFRAYSKAVGSGGGVFSSTAFDGQVYSSTEVEGSTILTSNIDNYIDSDGGHNHGIYRGTLLLTANGGSVYWEPSGDHQHELYVPEHSHNFEVEDHSHEIDLPDHTHELEFGIYEGETANSAVIVVDGRRIPNAEANKDVDIISYLGTDNAGRIKRNEWHTVTITPNSMSRISANIFLQIFTNSRGKGDK